MLGYWPERAHVRLQRPWPVCCTPSASASPSLSVALVPQAAATRRDASRALARVRRARAAAAKDARPCPPTSLGRARAGSRPRGGRRRRAGGAEPALDLPRSSESHVCPWKCSVRPASGPPTETTRATRSCPLRGRRRDRRERGRRAVRGDSRRARLAVGAVDERRLRRRRPRGASAPSFSRRASTFTLPRTELRGHERDGDMPSCAPKLRRGRDQSPTRGLRRAAPPSAAHAPGCCSWNSRSPRAREVRRVRSRSATARVLEARNAPVAGRRRHAQACATGTSQARSRTMRPSVRTPSARECGGCRCRRRNRPVSRSTRAIHEWRAGDARDSRRTVSPSGTIIVHRGRPRHRPLELSRDFGCARASFCRPRAPPIQRACAPAGGGRGASLRNPECVCVCHPPLAAAPVRTRRRAGTAERSRMGQKTKTRIPDEDRDSWCRLLDEHQASMLSAS